MRRGTPGAWGLTHVVHARLALLDPIRRAVLALIDAAAPGRPPVPGRDDPEVCAFTDRE